ncbi:MAG: peptidoglycan-binding protein [Ideonella sp. MAG2]|nr:MAG: peptidoglycan-binding protein [Ideonella sp. MAG2]
MTPEQKAALARLNQPYSSVNEGWRRTIASAIDDLARWITHDAVIQRLVNQFTDTLKPSKMPVLDWRLVRAMIWTETNPYKVSQWSGNVMQIGVTGDPGMNVVLQGDENVKLILDDASRKTLTKASITTDPNTNILAGMSYMLSRMCESESFEEIDPAHPKLSDHVVKKGETLDAIAKTVGCSTQWLLKLNNQNPKLAIGQTIKVQATLRGRRISSWRAFTPENLQSRYNGNGDPHYAKKLHYCLGVMDIIAMPR